MRKIPFAGNNIHLDEEERNTIMRMAALSYTPRDIAIYLDVNIDLFIHDAQTPYTDIWLLIEKGKLDNRAKPELQLQIEAEKGNVTAIQELQKVLKQRNFETIIQQLDEDEL